MRGPQSANKRGPHTHPKGAPMTHTGPWHHQGGGIPQWGGRRTKTALQALKKRGKQTNTPCAICGQPIDYTLDYPDPNSCSVQHLIPRSVRPELTWEPSNWAPAHLTCNKAQGAKLQLDLGVTSTRFT